MDAKNAENGCSNIQESQEISLHDSQALQISQLVQAISAQTRTVASLTNAIDQLIVTNQQLVAIFIDQFGKDSDSSELDSHL